MTESNKPPLNPEDVRRCGSTFNYDSGGTMPEVIQCDRYDGHEGSHSAPTRSRFVWSDTPDARKSSQPPASIPPRLGSHSEGDSDASSGDRRAG